MPIPHTFNPVGRYRDSELYWLTVQPGIVTENMVFNITGTGTFRVVDWGDGTDSETVTGEEVNLSHTYGESGTYMVRIKAECSWIAFRENNSLVSVDPMLSKCGTLVSCNGIFYNCKNLVELPDGFSIPESVLNCAYMFGGCESLTAIPESFQLPSNVSAVNSLFNGCKALKSIPAGFRFTNSVNNCNGVFYQCQSLETIPDGIFIPSGVQNCAYMFGDCRTIKNLPSGLQLPDTVTTTQNMFNGCSALESFPDGFHVPDSVTNSGGMFYNCSSLSSDVSNMFQDFSSGTKNVQLMFGRCSQITGTVPAEKLWNNTGITWSNTSGCFNGCSGLTNYSEIPTGWK